MLLHHHLNNSNSRHVPHAFISGRNMAAGAIMTANIGRADRVAWLELELVGAAVSVEPDGDELESKTKLDGSTVGISTVIV